MLEGLLDLGVFGSLRAAHGYAVPFLGKQVQGQKELVVIHPVGPADSGPAEVTGDDYSESSRGFEEERTLREVNAVGVVREDPAVAFAEALEAKGVPDRAPM